MRPSEPVHALQCKDLGSMSAEMIGKKWIYRQGWSRLAVMMLALLPIGGVAQPVYPARPITLIVPTPPGGTLDRITRLASEKLRDILGQPAVLEYKPGAGLNIGAAYLARAAPDRSPP